MIIRWPDGSRDFISEGLSVNTSVVVTLDGAGNAMLKGDVLAGGGIPERFELHQNYPNPFNPMTTIGYEQPGDGRISIFVYDVLGRIVATLLDEHQRAGYRSVIWDGTDDSGRPVASGLYVCRMTAADEASVSRKMILAK